MRLILSLFVFIFTSATIAGSLLTALLSVPGSGLDQNIVIPAIAVAGFVIAAPFSYWLAGRIIDATNGRAKP